jgi:hypothetical protein
MIQVSLLTLFFFVTVPCKIFAQDEFIPLQTKRVTDFELKILRVTKDTLFYKSFLRNKFYLTEDLIAYRYKDSNWVYFNDSMATVMRLKNSMTLAQRGKLAELFLIEGGVTEVRKVKLISIRNDSLFYEGVLKSKFVLLSDLIAYRYKGEKWNFVNYAYRDNIRAQKDSASQEYKKRKSVLLEHAITNEWLNRVVNSCNNHGVYFHSNELNQGSWYLTKGRYVSIRLKADSLGTLFVLPLIKIYKDTLYFDKNYYDWDSYFSIGIKDLSYICFDIDFPNSQIPLEKRIKLESEMTLLRQAYESQSGIWLTHTDEKRRVVYSSVDIGY